MRLRIITLNLKGLANEWFERRCDVAVHGLRELSPDVICFQEATVHVGKRLYHQAAAIGAAIGLDSVAFSSYGAPGDDETEYLTGVAISSRWPMRRVRDRHLSVPQDARVVLMATLMAPGGDLDVITTHLAWPSDAAELRRRQAQVLFDEITVNGWHAQGARAVVAGDFNATEDEPVIRFASEGLTDTFRARHPEEPGVTWIANNPYTAGFDFPDRRLDYVFCPPGVEVRDARVVLDRPAPVYASDHFGVLADLQWR